MLLVWHSLPISKALTRSQGTWEPKNSAWSLLRLPWGNEGLGGPPTPTVGFLSSLISSPCPHPCSEMPSFAPPLPSGYYLSSVLCTPPPPTGSSSEWNLPLSLSLSPLLRPPGWPVLVPRHWFLKVMNWKVAGPPLSSCFLLTGSGALWAPHWLFWCRPHLAPSFCTDRSITASALTSHPKLQSVWDG